MVTAAVLGASGYAGGELIRLIDAHPSMDLVYLGAHSRAGTRLADVHPNLTGGERVLGSLDPERATGAEVVFLALPHGASAEPAIALRSTGVRVIDLGSDFRLDDDARYREAYGAPHPYPDELGGWVYGLPELFGDAIAGATTVAVPGCYPTSAVIGLGTLVLDGLIEGSGIIVDSMSGVSGAGRGLSQALQFGEVDESVKAYKVLEHRHQPEIESALDSLTGERHQVLFTPHLVPMQRGILSTIYARTRPGVTLGDLIGSIDGWYADAPFVRRLDSSPETRWVVGSNNALVSVALDGRSGTAVIITAIDNLVKGAAGQAVQCANLMLGFDETAGLPQTGWMP